MDNQQPSLDRLCKKCGFRKPLDEFPSYRAGDKPAWRHECRVCRKAYEAAWHRGEIAPKPVSPIVKTCVSCSETKPAGEFAKVYAERSRGKQYRSKTCAECARQKHAELMRNARARNAGLYRDHQKSHRVRHLERVRKQRRESGRRLRDSVYAQYGGYICRCCGETEPSMLTLDHINEDGSVHRNLLNGGRGRKAPVDIYRRLKEAGFPTDIQVLCYNCNISKHRNGGMCAHKIKEGSTTIPLRE